MEVRECCHNEELERKESATQMVRDLSEAVRQLGMVRQDLGQTNRTRHDETSSQILLKIRQLLEEI